jgi:integrase
MLRKRGRIYRCRFTAPDGTRVQVSTQTGDRKAAEEFEARLKAEHWRRCKLGEAPKHSWQELTLEWLAAKAHKRDLEGDRQKLRWLDQFLGRLMLDQITRRTLARIRAAKSAEASPTTANRYMALVRAMLLHARDTLGWISQVPKVPMTAESDGRIRWITRDEAATLLHELPEHLADMAQFTLCTGLRQANVSGLRWQQVDLQRRVAWIHADEAKGKRDLAVPLSDEAIDVLRRWIGRHPEYVFVWRGAPVHKCSTKAWYHACERAGLKGLRWHDLRHTWASWHAMNGTPLEVLQKLGGWQSLEMVLRYAHLSPGYLSRYVGNSGTRARKQADIKLVE